MRPEISRISELHQTHVLPDPVSLQDIYSAVQHNHYDVVHIAGHTVEKLTQLDQIQLNDDEVLTLDAASQIVKIAGAKLVFFNTCISARFAAYLVRHTSKEIGVIFSTVNVLDYEAWRLPVAYYEQLRRLPEEPGLFEMRKIFYSIVNGRGVYDWASSQQVHSTSWRRREKLIFLGFSMLSLILSGIAIFG